MIKTKPWTGGTEEEYETQHFGFGTQRLKIAVRQMVEQKITAVVKDMESWLLEALDLNEVDKETLTRSCNRLIHLYCERAGPSLEVIDEEIERLMRIPSNVLLPEDELQLDLVSNTDFENMKEELSKLRKRVERGALMEALLKIEGEELSTVEKMYEIAKKDMDVIDLLDKSIDGDKSLKTIKHETEFLCAKASSTEKCKNNIFED